MRLRLERGGVDLSLLGGKGSLNALIWTMSFEIKGTLRICSEGSDEFSQIQETWMTSLLLVRRLLFVVLVVWKSHTDGNR